MEIYTKKAFSLVEILVTVAIIGVLAALLLPVVAKMQRKALEGKSASNLRQIGAALFDYSSDHAMLLPVARDSIPYKAGPAAGEDISWQQQLDDYIGYEGTSDQTTGVRKVFTAPSSVDRGTPRGENGFFLGSYAAGYENGLASADFFGPLSLQKIKRTSMHIIAGEVGNKGQFDAGDADKDDYGDNDPAFGQKEPSRVVQILFADGHIGGFKAFDPTVMTVRYEGVDANGLGYGYSSP
jgi:prepilin-type N-terminal cleavage/methylation domain-containing protein